MLVPKQCHDALHIVIHHIKIYQQASRALMERHHTIKALVVYLNITKYYCNVLRAFVDEVREDEPKSNTKWRSAHLDYHFALELENNAFDQEMQTAALSKIKRTWDDFKRKTIYKPVKQRAYYSYFQRFKSYYIS